MSRFDLLWNNHPGRTYPCDQTVFGNQCAIRMGIALRAIGAQLGGLKTCVDYDARRFASHRPGHIRAAQDIANQFYRVSSGKGLGATSFKIYTGSMTTNMAALKNKKGMLFIMNGWGNTDHIDVWQGNGNTGVLKGGETSYFGVGQQVWLWEFA
jgi:hypothetical protein